MGSLVSSFVIEPLITDIWEDDNVLMLLVTTDRFVIDPLITDIWEDDNVEILLVTADRFVMEALIAEIFETDNVLIDAVEKLPTPADISETLSVVVALITAFAGSSKYPQNQVCVDAI